MAFLNPVQAAAAAGREVVFVALAEFEFESGTMRLWTGSGTIDVAGVPWIGSGILGSISAVTFGENDVAEKLTFSLSGVTPELVLEVRDAESVRGRTATLYGQFLDVATQQPLGNRFVVRQLIMDTISYGAQGPASRSISLTAESVWTARNLASFGYWSDRDQKQRYPGDAGCDYVPTLANKKIPWPVF